jgi:predicted GIY-YIG superfamily endonuclease
MEGAYLLHFSPKGYHHARHYLGWAANIDARVAEHMAGRGSRLCAVVVAAGVTLELVRTWPGGRDRERALKRRHSGVRLCPICKQAQKERTG